MRDLVEQATVGPCWISCGNYGGVRDVVWGRAAMVIWLNYSFLCAFMRGLRRTPKRGLSKEELWSGKRENLRMSFLSRDSILLWLIKSYPEIRRESGVAEQRGLGA